MKKISIVLVSFLILTAACKKNSPDEKFDLQQNLQQNVKEEGWTPMEHGLAVKFMDSLFADETSSSNRAVISNLLGYGYDATGDFADQSAARFAVFNTRSQVFKDETDEIIVNESNNRYLIAENAVDLSKKLSSSMDLTYKIFGFSGSIKLRDSETNKFDSRFVYGHYDVMRSLKRYQNLVLPNYAEPDLLSSKFKAAITANVPNDLMISYFGTHVMQNIINGGKLNFVYKAQTNNTERLTAAEVGVRVNFNNIFGGNLTSSFASNSNFSQINKNYNQSMLIQLKGGVHSHVTATTNVVITGTTGTGTTTTPIDKIEKWRASVTDANAVLVDFPANALMLISSYLPSRNTTEINRKNSLASYISTYLATNGASLTTPRIPTPPNVPVATFYKHEEYEVNRNDAYASELKVGSYTTPQLIANGIKNDDLSSVSVTPGYEVTLFEHDNFLGKKVILVNNEAYLKNYHGASGWFWRWDFNDKASSIKIRKL